MKCFRCQKEPQKFDTGTEKFVPINIGKDATISGMIGDVHVLVCQKCCGEIIRVLKEDGTNDAE